MLMIRVLALGVCMVEIPMKRPPALAAVRLQHLQIAADLVRLSEADVDRDALAVLSPSVKRS
jgi:hypothetical protein